MNVLSLFAGIGGLDLGLERAGMRVVGQVEIAPFCQRVLAKHWPEVPRHDDVRTTADWWASQPRPAVHVVAGGFPCQPFSLAGRQKGAEDDRYLWPAFRDVIRDLGPDYAVLENVPGLLRGELGAVLGDLAEIGYDAEWDCIPAATVGAPHLRDRVFVVAYPGGDAGRVQPVTEPGGRGPAVAGDDGPRRLVADALRNRRRPGWPGRPAVDGAARPALTPTGPAAADTAGEGRGPGRTDRRGPGTSSRQLQDWPVPTRGTWWATEPDVGRVAYGVPARVDRLRSLGNAVVPQVAEHIGRLVMAAAS